MVYRLRRKDPDPRHKDPRDADRQRREQEKQELTVGAEDNNGVKISPDKVDEIGRDPNKGSGLAYVMKHKDEFTAAGIPEDKIAEVVHRAAVEGKYMGYSLGKSPGRPFFEVQCGGQTHYVTVSVGDNGFIVGANVHSASTPFKDTRRDPRAEADPHYRGWGEWVD
ncbi:hypothetical protein AB0K14_34550 [Actinosynnema sp. NPDC050801]|uniref:hypothetical protein n=1 Tax=unclassified Actinosynnema TaxID=2637065 RepID=UPI0033D1DB45